MIPMPAGYIVAMYILGTVLLTFTSGFLWVASRIYLSQEPKYRGHPTYVPELYMAHVQSYRTLAYLASATGWLSAVLWASMILGWLWVMYGR